MCWRFVLTVFLLPVLLLFLGGCSKRRKMIEQYQAQIAQCDKEIDEIVNGDEWRAERDEVVNSLAMGKQEEEVRDKICRTLQKSLIAKYSTLEHRIADDLLKAVAFDEMDKMFQVFCEEPAIEKERVSDDMKKKIERELDTKNIYQIMSMLDAQYPMFRVSDNSKGITGDLVKFNKVNGPRRVVEGSLNAIMDNGARFGVTFCPFEDMPDEIVARIRSDYRRRFFRLKCAEIQQEQNAQVSKRLHEELPSRFLECGYLPKPSEINDIIDLTSAENWTSKHSLLEQAYKAFFVQQMEDKNYEYTEILPENEKEWIPSELLDKIGSLQNEKQVLQSNLQNLKKKRR